MKNSHSCCFLTTCSVSFLSVASTEMRTNSILCFFCLFLQVIESLVVSWWFLQIKPQTSAVWRLKRQKKQQGLGSIVSKQKRHLTQNRHDFFLGWQTLWVFFFSPFFLRPHLVQSSLYFNVFPQSSAFLPCLLHFQKLRAKKHAVVEISPTQCHRGHWHLTNVCLRSVTSVFIPLRGLNLLLQGSSASEWCQGSFPL